MVDPSQIQQYAPNVSIQMAELGAKKIDSNIRGGKNLHTTNVENKGCFTGVGRLRYKGKNY